MKKIFLSLALAAIISVAYSQTPEDALRYTRTYSIFSTARSAGMGGAFGSIGGDFGTLSFNPAGIGIYRNSEFSISPSLYNSDVESMFLGNTIKNNRAISTKFYLGNMGLVVPFEAKGKAAESGFTMFQFGIGLNTLNNYRKSLSLSGYNGTNSITTGWVDMLNDDLYTGGLDHAINNLDPYSTNLAWDTYLIDTTSATADGNYTFFSDMYGGGVLQSVRYNTSGSMHEFVISGGFNWKDKLYGGLTVGIPYFSYQEAFVINEVDDVTDEIVNDYFTSMQYSTNLTTHGSGINMKVGLIYRPMPWLRLGFAVHTPTAYNMSDEYYSSVTSVLSGVGNDGPGEKERFAESPMSNFEYRLHTPLRLMGSIGVMILQRGIVSADYEFVDYSKSFFRDKENFYDDFGGSSWYEIANTGIESSYTAGHNFRFGTEWAIGNFMVRAGYVLRTSPYANNIQDGNVNGESVSVCGGVGLHLNKFFVDLTYCNTKENFKFYPYQGLMSSNKLTSNNIMLSLGFKF